MTEKLLQFIWQFQYFNGKELRTTSGEELLIIHQGSFNHHQGPDFLEARIKVGNTTWAGNVELHVNGSDWLRHAHGVDRNYDNVILHVVWNDDRKMQDFNIPTLVLGDRVSKLLIRQYEGWLNNVQFIPCDNHVKDVNEIIWSFWKERLVAERLQRKSGMVLNNLKKNNFHWEETLWWMVARNFGLVVNAESFAEMAMSVPYSILERHRGQIHQLEALLLGQAGLLNKVFTDKYPLMLQKEFSFLKVKYTLKAITAPVHFLRMRPACFPTIRLAQLAMLVHRSSKLFNSVINAGDLSEIKEMLNVTANDYWHYHFTFEQKTRYQPKKPGSQMISTILLNSIIPVLYAYGQYRGEDRYINRSLNWMSCLSPEKNALTKKFRKLGIISRNAAESQALIELKTHYCNERRCLECAVGNAILKRSELKNQINQDSRLTTAVS